MSKYSGWVDGKPLPYNFKKLSKTHSFDYLFCLGDVKIGWIVRKGSRDKSWCCIAFGDEYSTKHMVPTTVEGFISRERAVDYMLKVHPRTRKTYMHRD